MIRTQIQLPNELYARAKKLADAREISLAELARRGREYMLSVHSPEPSSDWRPPKPRRLGLRGLTDEELKREAQAGPAEIALSTK